MVSAETSTKALSGPRRPFQTALRQSTLRKRYSKETGANRSIFNAELIA